MIIKGLKKRLEGVKGNWAKELPSMFCAYQTTSRRSTGEIPLSMIYRVETVIPMETRLSSIRVANFSPGSNDAQMIKWLDLLEESRDMASIRLANYQQKLAWGYNRNVRPREFVVGYLVLQRTVRNMKDQNTGKLAPN